MGSLLMVVGIWELNHDLHTFIDEESRRWMVHFIHQSGMLLVWPT